MLATQRPGLYIISSDEKDRCVHCMEDIEKGSVIEVCPVIILDKKDTAIIHKSILHDYYFMWDIDKGSSAIALGFGSLYNHSQTPNAEFEIVAASKEMRFYAIRDIPAGTEICINYIGLKIEGMDLWFEPE